MRCFIGSFLHPSHRSIVQSLVPNLDGLRWVRPERYHVTLAFLGDLQQDGLGVQLDRAKCLSKSFPIVSTTAILSGFPRASRARVVVILLGSSGKLESLELRKENFKPHITLGYARNKPVNIREKSVSLELLFEEVGLYESKDGEYIRLDT